MQHNKRIYNRFVVDVIEKLVGDKDWFGTRYFAEANYCYTCIINRKEDDRFLNFVEIIDLIYEDYNDENIRKILTKDEQYVFYSFLNENY